MEQAGVRPTIEQMYPEVDRNDFTILDHALIGSGQDYRGTEYDGAVVSDLLEAASGVVPEELRTPLSVLKNEDPQVVDADRSGKYVRGYITAVDVDWFFDNVEGRKERDRVLVTDLSAFADAEPRWKVFVVNKADGSVVRNIGMEDVGLQLP